MLAEQLVQSDACAAVYPKTFTRLQKAVKRGTFQPIGGTWVECDGNLPSGESFVRQFLYGQRYFESRFGQRSNIFVSGLGVLFLVQC